MENRSSKEFFGMRVTHPRPEFNFELREEFANLIEELNKKLMVSLRDGRSFVGWLTSVDQFTNIVLTDAVERICVGKEYGDLYVGVVMIRGDNLVIVGEINEENEQKKTLTTITQVSEEQILRAQKEQLEKIELQEKKRIEGFKERGLHYIPHQRNLEFAFRLGEDHF